MKIIFSSILICFIIFSQAQKTAVVISIKNEKAELVQNCTAKILSIKDSSILEEKVLTANTKFLLAQNNFYYVNVTIVGYQPIFKKILVKQNDTTFIFLTKAISKNLDEVVVKSVKQFIKQEDDKTIVDAEPIASTSTNALEIIEKTPGVIVDQDGNVYLNSATAASISINGRELKMSDKDIASFLKSLPASSVSKIEILRNPSAKYDAASTGGMINIALKKDVKLGINGSLDVSHFQGVYGTESIGFNVNENDKKWNLYLSYNFTNRTNFQVINSERPQGTTLFIQDGFTKFPAATNYAGGGVDYSINKKWSINFDTRFTANNNRSNVNNAIDIFLLSNRNIEVAKNQSLVSNTGPTYFIGNTLASKCKIDSIGSEWTNTFDYTYFKSDNNQQYDNLTYLPINKFLLGDGNVLNTKNIVGFKSDVLLKTNTKYSIEFGTKLNFNTGAVNSQYLADTGFGKYINTFQTNGYNSKENIIALYFQVSKTIGGFSIKPGIRFEYTDIIGNQTIPAPQKFTINRSDFFPYLYIRHDIAKLFGFKLVGSLTYRKSITRPNYEALNPFPKYADQYTFDIGNPNLSPQLTDNYEIAINANDFPIFSLGLNDIKNIFTNLTYSRGDTLFRTFDNLATNKEVYMRLVGGIPPGKKYFFYAGTQFNAINFDGIYNGVPFKYSRGSWNVFTFHSYKVSPSLSIGINGWMRINGVTNFFETRTFGTLNLSATKILLNKKLNIILSVNDLLRTNLQNFNVNVPKFTGSGTQYTDTRRLGIAVKYIFGKKPKPEKRQGFDIPQDLN